MAELSDFFDLARSGDSSLDALLKRHMEYLQDVSRSASLPAGEPDKSRKEIEKMMKTLKVDPDKKAQIDRFLAISRQVSPPLAHRANDGTGRPGVNPEDPK